jgi:hypothetical protein
MPVFSAIGRLRRIKNRKRNPLNRHPLMNRRLISFQLSTGTSTGARRHGYTAAQRYFLAYGQIWCQNVTDQEARKRVLTDSHSPCPGKTDPSASRVAHYQPSRRRELWRLQTPATGCKRITDRLGTGLPGLLRHDRQGMCRAPMWWRQLSVADAAYVR